MNSEEFERSMVDVLSSLIEARGLKHDPTATQAWPHKKAPGRTWQAIRSPENAQKLTVRDAYSLAQVLNISMSQLCALVEAKDLGGILPKGEKKQARQTSSNEALSAGTSSFEYDNQ